MSLLRDSAREQECLIRIPHCCNFKSDTVVLCHYRLGGLSGMGFKASDILGAFGCSACHDLVDGRTHSQHFTRKEILLMHAEGIFRTQAWWLEHGFIKAGGDER